MQKAPNSECLGQQNSNVRNNKYMLISEMRRPNNKKIQYCIYVLLNYANLVQLAFIAIINSGKWPLQNFS